MNLMRIRTLVVMLFAALGLVSCQDPDDGPRHLTPEEIEKYKQEQSVKIEKYVEYRQGNCPIILTVPHGGTVVESFLTLRNTSNCPDPDFATDLDYNTRELADEIDKAFFQQTGKHPYMIIALIKRNHVDFNRQRNWAIPAGDENIGKIYDDGTVRDGYGHNIGKIYDDGTVRDGNGHNIGSAKGLDKRKAALMFFFHLM